MATTLNIAKRDGIYLVDGIDNPTVTLEFNKGPLRNSGTITISGKKLPIAINPPSRGSITVGGDQPVLVLDSEGSFVPGVEEPVSWISTRSLREGYRGSLSRGSDVIEFALQGFMGGKAAVTVGGEWEHLELIALAGSFALMSRRRSDGKRNLAVGAIVGPQIGR